MARIARAVLIVFTYIFDLLISLFVLGVGAIGYWTREPVHFELIPHFRGTRVLQILLLIGILGIIALVLSFGRTKILRLPLLLWNAGVLSLLVCAFTRSSYRFSGRGDFMDLVWFTLLAVVAVWASWSHFWRTPIA
jgi:hypothetical protein